MTPNEELIERFRTLSERLDRARDKFMARKAPPVAIEANPRREEEPRGNG